VLSSHPVCEWYIEFEEGNSMSRITTRDRCTHNPWKPISPCAQCRRGLPICHCVCNIGLTLRQNSSSKIYGSDIANAIFVILLRSGRGQMLAACCEGLCITPVWVSEPLPETWEFAKLGRSYSQHEACVVHHLRLEGGSQLESVHHLVGRSNRG